MNFWFLETKIYFAWLGLSKNWVFIIQDIVQELNVNYTRHCHAQLWQSGGAKVVQPMTT